MSRKVSNARLHTTIFIDGIGDLGPSLPSKTKTVIGFAMVEGERGLELFGNNASALVPWSNVQCVTFEDKAKEEPVSKKVKAVA